MVINTSTLWLQCKAETRSTCDIKWASKVNFDGRLFTLLCISPSRMFILYTSCRECLILNTIGVIVWIFLGPTFSLASRRRGGVGVPLSKRAYWIPILTSNLWVSLCIWTWSERGVLQDCSQSSSWTLEPTNSATLVKSQRMLNRMPLHCRLIGIRTSHCDAVLMVCDMSLTPHRCDWISEVCLLIKHLCTTEYCYKTWRYHRRLSRTVEFVTLLMLLGPTAKCWRST